MNTLFINIIYRLQKVYNLILSVLINYEYDKKQNPSVSEKTIIEYNKTRNKGPKKIICNAPFKHMYFGIDGSVSACCANKTEVYGLLSEHNINELWNSESINLLRDKIKNYNLSGGCYFCNHQLQTNNYKAFIGKIYDSFLPQKPAAFPTEMTFEISNTCNLECVMCDGFFSSSIRKNREKLPPLEDKYGPDFFDKIKAAVPYLKVARFQGGEPFLIPQYYDIIEYIIQQNKDCKIFIQTNGTILNERVKKIIKHKNVHLSISIDSLAKENYETIRKNASFEKLMNNMEFFKLRSRDHNQFVNINFCVMTGNWQEVPSMLAFCNENNFTLTLIPVESPRSESLQFITAPEIENIIKFLKKPEHLTLLKSNHFNAEKYTDLLKFLDFHYVRLYAHDHKLMNYQQMDNEVLRTTIENYFNDPIFKGIDILPVFDFINSEIKSLQESEQREILADFLADLESNYSNLKNDYTHNIHWPPDFKKYFQLKHSRLLEEKQIN